MRKKEIIDLWGRRNRVHICNIPRKEYKEYTEEDYQFAMNILTMLIERLDRFYNGK